MKRLAIIGLGDVSKYVIEGIKKSSDYQIVGLCDKNSEKLKNYNLSNAKLYSDYKKMISEIDFDYIVLLVHQSYRRDILIELIRMGHKVICEKPFACSPDEMNMILAACKEYSNYPIIMYHRSYNRQISKIYNLLDSKSVKRIEIKYLEEIGIQSSGDGYKYIDDKHGGGCIQDNFPNCIHYMLNYGDVSLVKCEKKVTDYCTAAKVYFLLNGQIECNIYLDWHSEIDDKSVVIYTDQEVKHIDLQQGYAIPKESLIDEYAEFFRNFEKYNLEKMTNIDIKIVGLINDILLYQEEGRNEKR